MTRKKQKGFTIIEVVLVIAIAGLIFLVVFMALPALQKSRRDTQRKSDMAKLIALLETYHGNTGKLPMTDVQNTQFIDSYIDTENFADPSTGSYDVRGVAQDTANGHYMYPEDIGIIYFKARHFCADGPYNEEEGDAIIQHEGDIVSTAAVWTKLERGRFICIDSGWNDNS